MSGMEPKELAAEVAKEVGVSAGAAEAYVECLSAGKLEAGDSETQELLKKGLVILSGDGKRHIPVHPRLAVGGAYRTWREEVVRELNARRMKMDALILRLIPLYENATEKRGGAGGG